MSQLLATGMRVVMAGLAAGIIRTRARISPALAYSRSVPSQNVALLYVSEGTADEWQTWRRSLHEFAPLLFRN